MAEIRVKKGSEEWEMFRDFWNLYQKYGLAENTDKYWEDVVKAVGVFTKKYKSVFANKLGEALFTALEAQMKERG
ncbi:MAG: hypothetical protein LKJ25_03185 [Clostridia bacterium]|jgi:hypothetical protein|nr:hypothetical protein [Clostridia bacterium]